MPNPEIRALIAERKDFRPDFRCDGAALTNGNHARQGEAAVRGYTACFGAAEYNGEEPETPIADLITCILHYTHSIGADPLAVIDSALMHFEAETNEAAPTEEFKSFSIFIDDMGTVPSFTVRDKYQETKEEEWLWHVNRMREHDGLAPLSEVPADVVFSPVNE